MPRTVHCARLKREAPGLAFAPWPGALGKRIYEEVSQEAWSEWLAHQTLLINEHRLSPLEPRTRAFLEVEMQKFFFGDGVEKPAGYVSPET